MTTLMDLYYDGVMDYLIRTRIVSPTILSYIQYYEGYNRLKCEGKNYRESVRLLSERHRVSETTIKKGIRVVHAAQAQQKVALQVSA